MVKDSLKDEIRQWVENFVAAYAKEHGMEEIWRAPLVGFADVQSPYLRKLPEIVVKEHYMPEKFMDDPTVVISYFVPFSEKVGKSNAASEKAGKSGEESGKAVGGADRDNLASMLWADAYKYTNDMMPVLNKALAAFIQEKGYRAVVPDGIGMRGDVVKSNWSQRHIARAAGLGTFGVNNMLITERGGAGRYNSIVSDIPVTPDQPLETENCLYKREGTCGKCVENCFSGALTFEGFDRHKCREICNVNEDILGEGVCGKCAADVPCSFCIPDSAK